MRFRKSVQAVIDIMKQNDALFETLDFGQGVYHTRMPGKTPGPGRVFSSLIVGQDKALVIDTGYGIGDYLAYLRTITDKPLIVVNTHGHIDHASGNSQFGEAWINQKDWALADWHTALETRQKDSGCEGYANLLVSGSWEKRPLEEGMRFDLGGRQVTAYECAGHTKGSMSFLDSETGFLFTGDNLTRRVLLLGDISSTSVPEFYDTVCRTKKLSFSKIIAVHVPYLMPREWLDRIEKIVLSFNPEKGKVPVNFSLSLPGMIPMEFTEGDGFDDPEYCGFVFDAAHLETFLGNWYPRYAQR